MPKSFTQESHWMNRVALMPFKISQVKPTEYPTTTFNLSLPCFPHASHSISHSLYLAACLVFSPPLLVWWLSLHSLCSSRTPHSAPSAASDRTSQTAAMTDISQPPVSPLADLIPRSLTFPFTLNARTALNRLSIASSKDYRNHRLSLCSGTDWLDSSILNRRMWLCCTVWYEHAWHFSCGRTASSSRLSAVTQSFLGKQRSLHKSAGRMECDEPERKLFPVLMLGRFPHPAQRTPFYRFCSYIQKNLWNLASNISNHNHTTHPHVVPCSVLCFVEHKRGYFKGCW